MSLSSELAALRQENANLKAEIKKEFSTLKSRVTKLEKREAGEPDENTDEG